MKEHVKTLKRLGAGSGVIAWARTQPSMQSVWDHCPRADWLCWLIEETVVDHDDLRLAAAYIAQETPTADGRVASDLLTDNRSWTVLRCVERHALGLASDVEMSAARPDAIAAARGASLTRIAAAAWAVAMAATGAGVTAAVSGAASDAAAAAASDVAASWQADAIRMHLPGLLISDAGVITYDSSAGWRAMAAATGEAE